jgi:hypothetical protein
MLPNVFERSFSIAKRADVHGLAGNVVKDMAGELSERLLDVVIQSFWLVVNHSQHLVIDLAVLDLFHETDRLAIENRGRLDLSFGQDEAVHVISIFGRGAEDESVGKWIGARDALGCLQLQGLFVMNVFHPGAGLVFDEDLHDTLMCRPYGARPSFQHLPSADPTPSR